MNEGLSARVMEYDVVIEPNRRKLIEGVNDLIKEGWRPLGPAQMTAVTSRGKLRIAQTMVKDED